MKKKILIMCAVVVSIFALSYDSNLEEIKNNDNIVVQCQIKGKGYITIDKSKITGIMDDGTFIFTNGSAKNCDVSRTDEDVDF